MDYQSKDRRPIPLREKSLSKRTASLLVRAGVSANVISSFSLLFGIGAGICLVIASAQPDSRLWWALAAALILLRLLANMMDGMVAIEAGKTSAVGELFNEIPDRVSDAATFIGAGFAAASSPHLGYTTAILALLVAYVRALGNQMDVTGLFIGPMSKQQRMFTLIAICLFYLFAPIAWLSLPLLIWGLWIISLGAILTFIRRIGHIVKEVNG